MSEFEASDDMNFGISDDFEEDDSNQVYIDEMDARILKVLVSNYALSYEFVNSSNYTIFPNAIKPIAKSIMEYVKAYKVCPTQRVLLDKHSKDETMCSLINTIWGEFNRIEVDYSEFKYDIDKLKTQFSESKIRSIKEISYTKDIESQIKIVQKTLDEVRAVKSGTKQAFIHRSLRDYMPEFRTNYIQKVKHPELAKGVHTGYSFLDYVTNGLQIGDMLIIGGETSAGKSMFLNNMAKKIWMQGNNIDMDPSEYGTGKNVLYFSLEMPFDQCVARTLCSIGRIPSYSMRDAKLNEYQLGTLSKINKFIAKYPYDFDIVDIPRGTTIENIEQRYLDACSRGKKPDVVVVDYLGLLEDNEHSDKDDWLKLGFIAGKLHEFGRTHNTIVLTAVQLNTVAPKDNKKPDDKTNIGMHRIGRSKLIMHHANIAIQIESRPNEHTYSDMKYHIIKNRNGERGEHILQKDFRCASLDDMDPPFMPPPEDEPMSLGGESEDLSAQLAKIGWFGAEDDPKMIS